MSCGSKNLDGLSMFTEGGGGGDLPNNPTLTGDVTITGDLDVQGGDVLLGVGVDGWSNIRSHTSAFGLDIMAPLTKKIRLINDIQSVAEIDTEFKLIGGSGNISLVPPPSTTTYDFILPTDLGTNGLVLTSQGSGQPLYWTAGGGGGGGGTVTSVAITVPSFLSIAGSPITTTGTFTITYSGTPLPVLNGGTGVTTETGSGGDLVLNNQPHFRIGIRLDGFTSGTVFISVDATTDSYDFFLPSSAGTPGQVLTNQGGSPMTWTTPATGTVTSVDMTVPTFLNVSGGPVTGTGTFTIGLSGTPLPVLNGGTGSTTSTGTGSVVLDNSPTLTSPLCTNIRIQGSTSGVVTIKSSTGTFDFNLPTTAGLVNQVLTSQAGGTMIWTTPTATGVTSVAITVPSFLSVSGSPITSTGTFTITLSGTPLPVLNGGTGSTTSTGVASSAVVLADTPTLITPNIGVAQGTSLKLNSPTSGNVTIATSAGAVTTYLFTLPTTGGTVNQVLTSQGGTATPMTWTTLTTGTVTSVGITPPSFLNASAAITTSGNITLSYNGTPLPVLNGGTGVTTSTGTGSVVLSTTPTLTNPLTNTLGIKGSTSGTISILPQAIAGTYNFNLPTTAGSLGQVLTSGGGSTTAMTWSNVGSGTVTSVGLAVPAFLNVSGSPIVSNGTITVGLSGTPLLIANGGTSSTTATGTGSVVLQASPTITGTLTTGRIQASASVFPDATTFGYIFQNTSSAAGPYINGFHFPNLPLNNDVYLGTGPGLTAPVPSTLVGFHYRPGSTSFASLSIYGCIVPLVTDVTGQVRVQANIASTSTTTGSLLVTGGIGSTGAINAGGAITTTSTTASTSTTTGSIITAGGIGAAGAINSLRLSTLSTLAHSFSTGINNFINNNNTNGFNTTFQNQSLAASSVVSVFLGRDPTAEGVGLGFIKGATAASNHFTISHVNVGESAAFFPPGTASTTTTTGTTTVNGGLGVNGRVCATEFLTSEGFPFTYTNAGFSPILTIAGPHTVTVLGGGGRYTLIGNVCTYYFRMGYNVVNASPFTNDIFYMSIPFAAYFEAAAPLSRKSDLKPGADVPDKDYTINLEPFSTLATFAVTGNEVSSNAWQTYQTTNYFNCMLSGTITYIIAP